MTRKQQALRLFLLAGLGLLAGVWLLFPPKRSQPESNQARASTTSDAASPKSGPLPRVPAAVTLPDLPPRHARAQDVFPTLQARADAGDAIAACRLSVELMRCQIHARKFPGQLESLERKLTHLRDKGNPIVVAEIEARLNRSLATESSCALLPKGLADRAQHYLRAAALAGEPLSRFRYAAGAGFEDTGSYGYLVTPAFDQWRREAVALMQQSLAEGRPEAVLVLALARANDQGLFGGLVADDPALARAHARLMERVFGESLAAFPLPLPRPPAEAADPAAAAKADALAAQWHEDYFGGRRHDLMALLLEADNPWHDAAPTASAKDPCPGAGAQPHG